MSAPIVIVFVPVNLFLVERLTRFRSREFATMAVAPKAAGAAAVAVVWAVCEATAIETIPPLVGLVLASGLAVATAVGVQLLLDGRSRSYMRALRGLASSYRPSARSAPGG